MPRRACQQLASHFHRRPSSYRSSVPVPQNQSVFSGSSIPSYPPRPSPTTLCTRSPEPDGRLRTQPPFRRLLNSSYTAYLLIVALACGSALLVESVGRDKVLGAAHTTSEDDPSAQKEARLKQSDDDGRLGPDMPIPPGHVGNLTPDQEAKLREFWAVTLKVFGVEDSSPPVNGADAAGPDDSPSIAESENKEKKKKDKRLGLFRKKNDDSRPNSGTVTPTKEISHRVADADDKYGQVKEFQQILAMENPESLRATFWSMVKADHPDGLLLRFLRARKWDVDKALVMMISTMKWRSHDMHVDDDVVLRGEGGALEDCQSSDPNVRQEGEGFLAQLKLGKSFLHGTDKEGRPLCFVRVRLHHSGDQTQRSTERYTVYMIETARLVLQPPVETACIIFDMTNFALANMDYSPVKFMIKVFEANYPESLGAVLVHKAPWIFQGFWKIIRAWLDPVVAGKIHFTDSVKDLEEFIPRSQIIKELGGDEDWEYKYIDPTPGENDAMKEDAPREKLLKERHDHVLEYQKKTFQWIALGTGQEAEKVKAERHVLARKLDENYWKLDPYIRARTYYDRYGMISKDGKINFYPPPPSEPETSSDDVD